ncbi:MAG: hypothetical protein WBN94_00070 [Methanothrix sp.]
MKYIPFLVALVALSIFVVPATSMQGNENAMNMCKPQIEMPQDQQQCDCPNALAAQGNKNCDHQSMMDGKQQAPCGHNSENGPVADNGPKNMMDGKQQGPCGHNSENGPVADNGPKNMMDNVVPK